MIPTVESVYCENCESTQPLRTQRMPITERNDHEATDLICATCAWIVATLHHPVEARAEQEG